MLWERFLREFYRWLWNPFSIETPTKVIPTSVNYHFTRQCNYSCGFCFHTAKTSFVLPIEEAKRGLKMLLEAGMEKINFSGGEPFIHQKGDYLGELVRYCKAELELSGVSIVSNGSLITEKWFSTYGEYLDILAISCDSFDQETNRLIGRGYGKRDHIKSLEKVRQWCNDYHVAFKLNTVVNTLNVTEDMNHNILTLNPVRWKVFQCLIIGGENAGKDALKNAENLVVSDEQFQEFTERHKDIACLVIESNQSMRDSYLILDERMRFLDCTGGEKIPSASLLDVGVENAIQHSGFDEAMFFKRGGKYTWTKFEMKHTSLDW